MTDCELVKYLSDGHFVKEIAQLTGLNKRTLEKRIEVLKQRCLCNTSAHLVANYLRKKLIE